MTHLAYPEAVVGTNPTTPIPVLPVEVDDDLEVQYIRTRQEVGGLYVMFHWPWSLPGDPESHSLLSFN